MKRAYTAHLQRLHEWLALQANMAVLRVGYNHLVERPREQAERVAAFVGGTPDVERMAKAVDRSLYRNRKNAGASTAARPA